MLSLPTAKSVTSRRLVVVEINSVVSRETHGHGQRHVQVRLGQSDLEADALGVAVAEEIEIDPETIGVGVNPAEGFPVDPSPTGAETALGSLVENPIHKFGRIYKRIV